MPDLVKLIPGIIQWVIVPLLLLGILGFGVLMVSTDPRLKTSTTAGKWAGAVIFVLFVVGQRRQAPPSSLAVANFDVNPYAILCAVCAGFAVVKGLNWVLRTELAGLLALFLVAASLTTLYAYFFMPSYQGLTVNVTLGCALGALLEVMVFLRDATGRKEEG